MTELRNQESLLPTIKRLLHTKPGELLHRLWLKLASEDVGRSRFLLRRLEGRNAEAQTPVVATGGPVVSLTTYGKRIDTDDTHGTGCTFASVLACGLGSGLPIADAFRQAVRFVRIALLSAPGLGNGHGPMGHALGVVPFDEIEG